MTTKDLKLAIAKLVAIQKDTKKQRKTVKFTGVRTMQPWEATYKAQSQKWELMHMYIAYAQLRGKDISKVIGPKTEYSQKRLTELLETYGEAIRISEVGS